MSEPLSTLTQRCRHQAEIKKSRFLAQAAPVTSTEQALAFVQEISDPTATHNCWAYCIGQDYRFTDDGEPGGSAGRPILQGIEGQAMDRVVVVVTRWYGGTKLGVGGLVRAYGGTAAECLRSAEREIIVASTRLSVHCDFAELPLLKARMKDLQAELEHESFGADGVTLELRLPDSHLVEAELLVSDVTRGRNVAKRLD
jgi:uncharacterized YigZ family protein